VAWLRSKATLRREGIITPRSPDPNDDYLIELATSATVDYLVTGDSHLLNMEWTELPPIVSPRRFLEVLTEQEAQS